MCYISCFERSATKTSSPGVWTSVFSDFLPALCVNDLLFTDYLVDDGTECNSTSDLLLERNREQSLIDLLIPALVLLINLLKKLQVGQI